MKLFLNLVLMLFTLSSSAIASDSFEAPKALANQCFSQKKFDEAINNYHIALSFPESDKNKAIIYANLGQCFRAKNEPALALEHFDRALELDPLHKKALYQSVRLRLSQNAQDHAIIQNHLDTAIQHYPEESDFYRLVAEFNMMKNGDWIVPDVSYVPDLLSDTEAQLFTAIFKRAGWTLDKNCYHKCNLTTKDREEFEKLLGTVAQKLQERNLLPSQVTQFGYAMVRYDEGGFLEQHKDAKTRVDHFVLSISIGGPCSLELVRDTDKKKASLLVDSKSVFIMTNRSHEICTHGIANVNNVRYSILFFVPTPGSTSSLFDVESKQFVNAPSSHRCSCCNGTSNVSIIKIFSVLSFR